MEPSGVPAVIVRDMEGFGCRGPRIHRQLSRQTSEEMHSGALAIHTFLLAWLPGLQCSHDSANCGMLCGLDCLAVPDLRAISGYTLLT